MSRFTVAIRLSLPFALLMSCDRHPSATRAASAIPAARSEGYVQTDDSVRLFYRIVGSGPDTVVILHGGPGLNMEYFAADLEPLAERHTLLFYDQRGAGRSSLVSDSAGLTGARFVDDLEAIRVHFHLQQLTLLGHSWGAGVAALYAARFPAKVGRLLIVDGVPLRLAELTAGFEQMDRARDSTERAQMQQWMDARRAHSEDPAACHAYYVLWFRPFFEDPTAMRRSRGDFCAGTPASRRNKIQSVDRFTMASLGDWDWRPDLRSLDAPTLVIHGATDPIPLSSAREWASTLPDARLLILLNVGHFPYLEAPASFFTAVDTFLSGSWPSEATPRGSLP